MATLQYSTGQTNVFTTGLLITHSQVVDGNLGVLNVESNQYKRLLPAEVTKSEVNFFGSDGTVAGTASSYASDPDFTLVLTDSAKVVMKCRRTGLYRFNYAWGSYNLPSSDTGIAVEWFDAATEDIGLGLWEGRGLVLHNLTASLAVNYQTKAMRRTAGPISKSCTKDEEWNLWISDHPAATTGWSYANDASFVHMTMVERMRT